MAPYEHVFFDLDGTIVDNFDAIHQSFVFAGEELGYPVPSYEKVLRTVGGSVPVTGAKLFPGADPKVVSDLFETQFEVVMLESVRTYDGSEFILKSLKEKGIKCAIFTNKREDRSIKICEYLKLDHYFDVIVGTGNDRHRKPDKQFSEYALNALDAHPQTSCMIGDSPFDEAAAKIVNMDCNLVATGSHDEETLRSETSSPVFSNLTEIATQVFGLTL